MPVLEVFERTTTSFESIEIEQRRITDSTDDPFHIAHDCPNPSGHHFVADCSEVVCLHCARIAWR